MLWYGLCCWTIASLCETLLPVILPLFSLSLSLTRAHIKPVVYSIGCIMKSLTVALQAPPTTTSCVHPAFAIVEWIIFWKDWRIWIFRVGWIWSPVWSVRAGSSPFCFFFAQSIWEKLVANILFLFKYVLSHYLVVKTYLLLVIVYAAIFYLLN